ncbi:MAG: AI-2E family transporter [Planctomycetes bacterium]|nr:AI-2E family transporter [Planctomycetota bacterium]
MNWLHLLRLGIVGLVFFVGWQARAVTVPLLIAYLLMLVCLPWRQRWRKRIGDVPATLTCILALLVGPLILLLPIILESDELYEMVPKRIETDAELEAAKEWSRAHLIAPLEELIKSMPASAQGSLQGITEGKTLEGVGPAIAKGIWGFLGSLTSFFGGIFGIVSAIVLLPIFLFYLLEGAPWLPRIRAELPKSWRGSFDRTMPKIQNLLRTYCRARLMVAAAKGAMVAVILFVFGVPGPYTMGLMVGVASLVPVIGALISSAVLLVICVADLQGLGLLLAIGIYAVTELVEGYVLLPRLVGRELGMSDFVVILALLGGGALMGLFGLLVAIPAVAVGQVLLVEYVRPLMRDPVEDEASPASVD